MTLRTKSYIRWATWLFLPLIGISYLTRDSHSLVTFALCFVWGMISGWIAPFPPIHQRP